MRLVLRIAGTWLLALALILLIIDGTRSLGANMLVMTPLADTWTAIHAPSLEGFRSFLDSRFFGPLLRPAVEFILTLPGFAVIAVPGVILAATGRSRRSRMFVQQDQI
jgi:hypothetical protein